MSGSQYLSPKFSLEFFASKVYLLMVTLCGFRSRHGTASRSRSAAEASLQKPVCAGRKMRCYLCVSLHVSLLSSSRAPCVLWARRFLTKDCLLRQRGGPPGRDPRGSGIRCHLLRTTWLLWEGQGGDDRPGAGTWGGHGASWGQRGRLPLSVLGPRAMLPAPAGHLVKVG